MTDEAKAAVPENPSDVVDSAPPGEQLTTEVKIKKEIEDDREQKPDSQSDESKVKEEALSDQESVSESTSSLDSKRNEKRTEDKESGAGTGEEDTDTPKTNKGSMVKKVQRRSKSTDDNLDAYIPEFKGDKTPFQKPLQCGWYREIVLRGTSSEGRRRPADVYYFTPGGRKLRSAPQIADYLQVHDSKGLTSANFTFRKETVYQSPFEMVRQAGGKQNKALSTPSRPVPTKLPPRSVPTKLPPSVVSKLIVGKRLVKPSVEMMTNILKKDSICEKIGVKFLEKKTVLSRCPMQISAARKDTELKTVVIYPNDLGEKDDESSNDSNSDVNVETLSNDDPEELSNDTGDAVKEMQPKSIVYKPVKARKSFVRKRPREEDDENEAKKKKVSPICGLACPGVEDLPPTLVCKICQRLFHPQCVGVMDNTRMFCCGECFELRRSVVNDPLCVPNFEPEPLTMAPTVSTPVGLGPVSGMGMPSGAPHVNQSTVVMTGAGLSPLPTLTPVSMPYYNVMNSSAPATQAPAKFRVQAAAPFGNSSAKLPIPRNPRQPPPLTRAPPRLQIRPGLTVPAPENGVKKAENSATMPIVTDSATVAMPSTKPALASGISTVTLSSSLPGAPSISQHTSSLPATVHPKPASSGKGQFQLLSLPADVMNQLKLDTTISLKLNGKNITVGPKDIVNTPTGPKILLPPETLPLTSGQPYFNVSIPPNSLMKANEAEKSKPVVPALKSPPETASASKKPFSIQKAGGKQWKFTLSRVHMDHYFLDGYDSMTKIFDYLPLSDLLTCRQVCKKWRNIINQHQSMLNVSMEDRVITDWRRFADFLMARKTEVLDLVGMDLGGKFSKEWAKFVKIAPKFRYLKKISFGPCPPSVLYALALELPYLESLSAEQITETNKEPNMWYTNAVLDLGKLSSFRCLKELRLRGLAGLHTPPMAYTSVQRLSQLKQLRKLSLTSLKDVDGFELSFLETLDLDELEIGDCETWTEETYAYLNKLNLKKLHLENGGESNRYLTLALPNWQTLKELDLIMMTVDDSLARGLAKLTSLECLSICPDTRDNDALTNRNTLLAVRDLKHLKHFLWCAVMCSSEEAEDDEMEFLRQGIEDSLYYGETGRVPPKQLQCQTDSDSETKEDLDIDDEIALIEGRGTKKKKTGSGRKKKKENGEEEDVEMADEENMEVTDQEQELKHQDEKSDVDVEKTDVTRDEKVDNGTEADNPSEVKVDESIVERDESVKNNVHGRDLNQNENQRSEVAQESSENGVGVAERNEQNEVKIDANEVNGGSTMDTETDQGSGVPKAASDLSHNENINVPANEASKEDKIDIVGGTSKAISGLENKNSQENKTEVDKVDSSVARVDIDKQELKSSDNFESDEKVDESKENTTADYVNGKQSSETPQSVPSTPDKTATVTEKTPTPKKRRKKKIVTDVEPRRSGRKRTLKRSDDSEMAFVNVDTLIRILEYHLPNTDIRVDPIGLMK